MIEPKFKRLDRVEFNLVNGPVEPLLEGVVLESVFKAYGLLGEGYWLYTISVDGMDFYGLEGSMRLLEDL